MSNPILKSWQDTRIYLKNFSIVRKVYYSLQRRLAVDTAILSDSENKKLIAQFRRFRCSLGRQLKNSSDARLLALIDSEKFFFAIQPVHKDIALTKRETGLKKHLLHAMEQGRGGEREQSRIFFTSMLYFRPYYLPEGFLLKRLSAMKKEHIAAVYSYLLNLPCPYEEVNEADLHVAFLTKIYSWLESDIKAEPSAELKRFKLEMLSKCYQSSMPMCSASSMKDFYVGQRKLLKLYNEFIRPPVGKFKAPPAATRKGPIKIGFLRYNYAGDFCIFHPFLKYMDKEKYAIHIMAYDNGGVDAVKAMNPAIIDHHLPELAIGETVEYIRSLNLDILINASCIAGEFHQPLLSILSYRVAPHQMIYCADVTPTGIAEVDYFITGDNYNTPSIKDGYTERFLLLPGTGFVYPRPDHIGIVATRHHGVRDKNRAALLVQKNEILFVSTAHLFKLTPDLLTVWMRILQQVPHSKLLIMPYNNADNKARFRRMCSHTLARLCEEYGIQSDRLIHFNGSSEFIIRNLLAADIYLDSFPYVGPTSTMEALALGVPVLTLKSGFYRGSITAGLLEELPMPQLIAHTVEEYINKAVEMASSSQLRAQLAAEIEEKINAPSFFDQKAIARQLGEAFTELCGYDEHPEQLLRTAG